MDNVISVHLYGDGSRKSRLRAEYIHCDYADQCSAYKNGECFCVTTLFGVNCGVGKVHCIDGGTKQSKKYREVYAAAKNHENYAKLKYPSGAYVTKIAEKAFLTIPYTWLELDGVVLQVKDPHFLTNRLLMDADLLTPDNIKRICTEKPRAMMGGVIADYQAKIVPMFLHQLLRVFPGKYRAFRDAYPGYDIRPPDWRGRRAKLMTCSRMAQYEDGTHGVFRFDGDYLVCENYSSAFAPFGAKRAEIRIRVSDDMVVEITDNAQVTTDTVFV